MSAPELLPCPFCGVDDQNVLLVQHMEGTILHPTYRVTCDNCGGSSGWTDRGDHVAAWNTRSDLAQATTAAAVAAVIERAKGVFDRVASGYERAGDAAIATGIRLTAANALADPTGLAALEAVKAQVRAETMREAARIAEKTGTCLLPSGHFISERCRDAILAAIQEDKP